MSGSRGPLTLATSRRGERERRQQKNAGEVIVRIPEKPDWLPLAATTIWDTIIADLEDARVPLERIDGHAIAFYVLCVYQTAEAVLAGNTKLSARLNRDAIAWSGLIGATPASRARLGIKPILLAKGNKWSQL